MEIFLGEDLIDYNQKGNIILKEKKNDKKSQKIYMYILYNLMVQIFIHFITL